MKVLLVGVSNRPLAASAFSAGHDVISLDFFGDQDFPPGVRKLSLSRDFDLRPTLSNLAKIAKLLLDEVDTVVISGGIESEPKLTALAVGSKRLGNSKQSIISVRDIATVERALKSLPESVPQTLFPGDSLTPAAKNDGWLLKQVRSGGGLGVAIWDGNTPLKEGEYLQRHIPGELGSAVFAADGNQAQLLGLTRQYAGVRKLGADGYWWNGNVGPIQDFETNEILHRTANELTNAFGLIGLNNIDYILYEGKVYIIEVNPRYSGSVEILEAACIFNAFAIHEQACHGKLPQKAFPWTGVVHGKGILYAASPVTIPDDFPWGREDVRDVPRGGERIIAGAPICTLIASDKQINSCWHAILDKASFFQKELGQKTAGRYL